MDKKIVDELETYVFEDTKTVRLLDKFEGSEDDTVYRRIVLRNSFYVKDAVCHLVIERSQKRDFVGDITFTEFKKGYTSGLREHIEKEITKTVIKKYSGKKEIFYFKKPYRLRAQNSGNRTGYGSEWDWTDGIGTMVYEGTLYGETTDYIFAGVYIE